MRPRSTISITFTAVVVSLGVLAQAATVRSVDVLRYTAPGGETYFALPLESPGAKASTEEVAGRDIVILVDTSASQVGMHRTQALKVLDGLLLALSSSDRVRLYAVDVSTTPLMDRFSEPGGELVRQAVTTLRQRAPLGATRLLSALTEANRTLKGTRPGCVLFIGDGMSTAELVEPRALKEALSKFRTRHITVHSYGVGSRVDMQVLGVMAQWTGGTVLVDRGSDALKPAEIGRRLATEMHARVVYPSQVKAPAGITLLPGAPLPLRGDRQTIYLGRGKIAKGTIFSG